MDNRLSDVMEHVRAAGIKLWVEDGSLHYRTTQGPLTEDLKECLRTSREQIIDALQKEGEPFYIKAHPEEAHLPFPLTDVQSAYLLGRRESINGGGVSCHAYFEIELAGLTRSDLQRAFELIIERYDALRTVFDEAGFQRVLPCDQVKMPQIEEHYSDDGEARAALRSAMSHMVHDAHEPPLMSVGFSHASGVDIVHISIDFLIADWTGMMTIIDAFFDAAWDRESLDSETDITFRDYVLALQEIDVLDDKRYWDGRHSDIAVGADVPMLDSTWERRFDRLETRLSGKDRDTFYDAARNLGVSPSALLLALYGVVIARWSSQDANAIVVTLFDRKPLHPDVPKLVGDFTSTGYAVVIQRGQSLHDLANESFSELMGVVEHGAYSGVSVMRDIVKERGGDRAVYPFVFTSALAGDRVDDFDHRWSISYAITQTPQVGVDFQAAMVDGDLNINWDVRRGVFADGVIEAMFEAFCALLQSISDKRLRAGDPVIVPLPEHQARIRLDVQKLMDQRALRQDNAPRLLFTDMLRQAANRPDGVAVIDAVGSITFVQLRTWAMRLARQLVETGVLPGDRVGISTGKHAGQVACVYGVLLAGGVYVPIGSHLPDARKAAIASRADLKALLSDVDVEWFHCPTIVTTPVVQQTESLSVPEVLRHVQDDAYIIFTSGSTGEPKGVVVSHEAAFNTIEDIRMRFDVDEETVALGVSNLDFDLSVFDLFGIIGAGGTLVLVDQGPFVDPERWIRAMCRYDVNFWNSAPAQMSMVLDAAGDEAGLSVSLRTVLLSGDRVPPDIAERIHRVSPDATIAALGGATEASIWSNLHIMDDSDRERPSVPYGVPLTNQRMDVLDGRFSSRPDQVPGEICIAGASLAKGYLNDEALTADRFVSDDKGVLWYKTGDIGRWLSHGEIEFLGRLDTQVKIRGNRIELSEVETDANRYPGIGDSCALMLSEGSDGQIVLCVQPHKRDDGMRAAVQDDLQKLFGMTEILATRQLRHAETTNVDGRSAGVDAEVILAGLLYRFAVELTANDEDRIVWIADHAGISDSLMSRILSALEGFGHMCMIYTRDEGEALRLRRKWSSSSHVQIVCVPEESEESVNPCRIKRVCCDIAFLPESTGDVRHTVYEQTLSARALLLQGVFSSCRGSFSRSSFSSRIGLGGRGTNMGDESTAFGTMSFKENGFPLKIGVSLRDTGYCRVDVDGLLFWLRDLLPAAAVPKTVHLLDRFPHTENGKVDRKRLLEMVIEESVDRGSREASEGDEHGILDIVRDHLGKMSLSLDDNLISFGADSLVMAKLIAHIRREVPEAKSVSYDSFLRAVLDTPTARRLVETVDGTAEQGLGHSEENRRIDGLVKLSEDGDGYPYPDIARVIMHGATGYLDGLGELVSTMKESGACPLFSITLPDRERYIKADPETVIDELAETYAGIIAGLGYPKVQIVGHCIGGVMAVIVANYLLATGVDASAVVVDSLPMPFAAEDDLFAELIFSMAMGFSPNATGISPEEMPALVTAFRRIVDENEGCIHHGAFSTVDGTAELDAFARSAAAFYARAEADRAGDYAQSLAQLQGVEYDTDQILDRMRVFKQSFKASPTVLPMGLCPLDLIIAHDRETAFSVAADEAIGKWREAALDRIDVHDAPGDHFSVVKGVGSVRVSRIADAALSRSVETSRSANHGG